MRPLRLRLRLNLAARLLWAAPYSLLGLLVAAPACALGARLRRVDHTLECSGGALGRWMLRLPNRHHLVALEAQLGDARGRAHLLHQRFHGRGGGVGGF